MGYIEVLNGSGFTLRMENDKESLEPSKQICVSCNDDRLLHDLQRTRKLSVDHMSPPFTRGNI